MLNRPAPSPRSTYHTWTPVTFAELIKFIAVITQMGIDPKPQLRDYWSLNEADYGSWYHQMFSRTRFEAIYSTMLHCSEEAVAEGRSKVEDFVDRLLGKFRDAFYPYQALSLDEMVIGFQGRWAYKQFNASKPKKYHIKVFGLCDSNTGYTVNLLIYYGRDTQFDPDCDDNGSQAKKVFQTLLQPFGKGHHVFADRFYTCRDLVDYLLQEHTYYTGTLNTNRRNFPPAIKTMRLNHLESRWHVNTEKTILCVTWKDKKAKKPVTAISTCASSVMEERQTKRHRNVVKPALIHAYNQSMNGCDRVDQNGGYYGNFNRKTYKWWKKIFHWMVEIAQSNAHVLHTIAHRKQLPLLAFKKQLVRELVEFVAGAMTPEERTAKNHNAGRTPSTKVERFTGNLHLIDQAPSDRDCAYCSKGVKGGPRRRTVYYCTGCSDKPFLHPKDCFRKYHTP